MTIQYGRPYFFPNCKTQSLIYKTNLQYKMIPPGRMKSNFVTNRNVSLNYYNIFKLSLKKQSIVSNSLNSLVSLKSEFSKLFLKSSGKLYSCLTPQFFKKFTITQNNSKLNKLLRLNTARKLSYQKIDRTLLLQNSELISNENKLSDFTQNNYQLFLIKFIEQPFINQQNQLDYMQLQKIILNKMLTVFFVKIQNLLKLVKQLDY